MPLDPDEFAGVCDLFGGLTRAELAGAVADLAARRGDEYDRQSHDRAVANARAAYALLEVAPDAIDGLDVDAPLLVPGPRAFPTTPEGGEDLPHLLDAPRRDVPRDAVETALRARLAADVAALDNDGADDGEDGGENGSDDGGENERRTGKGVYDPLAAVDAAVERGVETTAALRAATGGGTYAGGDEERFGTLTVGGAADFVVLERSPWAADSIVDIDVEMTVVDGAVVHGAH